MDALEANGVLLKRGDGVEGNETFTKVARLTDFDGPDGSATVIDASALEDDFKKKLMGMADEGQFTFGGNLIPSDPAQQGLRTDRKQRAARNFQIVLTDDPATTLEFTAFVLNFSFSGELDGKISLSITLEVTGEVTWTAGA